MRLVFLLLCLFHFLNSKAQATADSSAKYRYADKIVSIVKKDAGLTDSTANALSLLLRNYIINVRQNRKQINYRLIRDSLEQELYDDLKTIFSLSVYKKVKALLTFPPTVPRPQMGRIDSTKKRRNRYNQPIISYKWPEG